MLTAMELLSNEVILNFKRLTAAGRTGDTRLLESCERMKLEFRLFDCRFYFLVVYSTKD